VGLAGLRFCIKPVLAGKSDGTCGVGKHISKFQPDQSFYYLRGNDVTAYCLPAFPQARLPSEIQLQLPMLKKTNQEWKDLFSRYESVSKSANADSANAPPVGVGKLVFKAPKKFLPSSDDEIPPVFVPLELREIEMQAELATDEALWWMEDDDTSLLSSPLMQFLRDVRSFLILYWQWLIEPHEIASNCLGAIEDDMHQLKKYCEALADNLGRPVNIIDMDFPDVWCALDYLGSLVSSLSSHTDLKDIQASLSRMDSLIQHIQPMMTNLQDLNARFGLLEQNNKRVDDIVAQHETRFGVIRPLLYLNILLTLLH